MRSANEIGGSQAATHVRPHCYSLLFSAATTTTTTTTTSHQPITPHLERPISSSSSTLLNSFATNSRVSSYEITHPPRLSARTIVNRHIPSPRQWTESGKRVPAPPMMRYLSPFRNDELKHSQFLRPRVSSACLWNCRMRYSNM